MKKKILLFSLASMFMFANAVWATPFPNKTDEIVQDEDGYLKGNDRDNFSKAVKKLPGEYKVVIVESTQPETQTPDEYAQKLFDNYNLSEETLMIVLDINTEQLGVYAGPALQAKGAKLELLHDKITSYYEPFRNQKEYLKGIELFITELNAETKRMQNNPTQTTASPIETAKPAKEEPSTQSKSVWSLLPWWLYLVGTLFVVLVVLLIYTLISRRQVFSQIDDVEDWKDELVEKINVIEVEKSLRRSAGITEERYIQLANRKENMLRVHVPEMEMIILEAEEACDRFRFQLAIGLLEEARETLSAIEQELTELKTDTTKVVATKKENKLVLPEIGKQFENVERKLSHVRLEYGLSFHDLKVNLDEVELLRGQVKEALSAGDDVRAYETTLKGQQILTGLSASLEQIPALVAQVLTEMPEELKQLQDGISQSIGDGYDLQEHSLEGSMVQAKQLLIAAKSALEEGNVALVTTHIKAFEVLLDSTYQTIEETLVGQKEAAVSQQETSEADVLEVEDQLDGIEANAALSNEEEQPEQTEAISQAERDILFDTKTTIPQEEVVFLKVDADSDELLEENDKDDEDDEDDEDEYELVIPKQAEDESEPVDEPQRLVIGTEDDALDELERISSALIRIRQHLKRSYLPGIPDRLKYHFDEVVQLLAQTKTTMERYKYELEEVSILLNDANELLIETEQLTERTISQCQSAEGAIQYTNRYRRQNRQVNELLTKAEQAFRQLSFQEALQIAEEARLVIEGTSVEKDKSWLLRRKKKGMGH